MLGRHRSSRRSRLFGGVLPVLFLAPASVIGQANGPDARTDRVDDNRRLCLSQLGGSPLPADFEFVGLTVSEGDGADPVITLWSRSDLLVQKLSAANAVTEAVARIPLKDVTPLSAAVVAWEDGKPVMELLDPRNGTIWTVNGTDGEFTRTSAPPGSAIASGAIRDGSGWVWVRKTQDPEADTARILISAGGRAGTPDQPATLRAPDEPQRGIDRLLHLRPDGNGGYLVQQAGFPFATIRFAADGAETWRVYPEPDELRDALEEKDLQYVIATPALLLDDAVLTTFVALRTRLRSSALSLQGGRHVRYRLIPSDLALLATFPQRQLLIGTRGDSSRSLIVLGWRWTDQLHSCT